MSSWRDLPPPHACKSLKQYVETFFERGAFKDPEFLSLLSVLPRNKVETWFKEWKSRQGVEREKDQ